jgi:sec-independent protein translocase protein TatB
MFDIGWTEMFVVIVVAVIVIGPKDLPRTLRTVGQWIGKVRAVGRDFQRGLDDMIRETELGDVKKQIESAAKLDLKTEVENAIDPTGTIKDAMQPVEVPEFAGDAKQQDAAPEPAKTQSAPEPSKTQSAAEPAAVADAESDSSR